jgi:hypothetical protein
LNQNEASFPLCNCGNPVDPFRVVAIGEVRCMQCPPPPLNVFMVPVSKSNEIITSDARAVIGSYARPGMVGRSNLKDNNVYMRLDSKK